MFSSLIAEFLSVSNTSKDIPSVSNTSYTFYQGKINQNQKLLDTQAQNGHSATLPEFQRKQGGATEVLVHYRCTKAVHLHHLPSKRYQL